MTQPTPISSYEFENNVLDSTGTNDALVFGTEQYTTGIIGNAYDFNGATFVSTPDLQTFFNNETVTISLLFFARDHGIIVDERGQSGTGFQDSQIEILPSGEVKVRVWPLTPVSLGTTSFNQWHHVVLRYDVTTQTLDGFLDGVKSIGSSTEDRLTTFETGLQLIYSFGRSDTTNLGSGQNFDGLIDDVRIFNFALTDSQIMQL